MGATVLALGCREWCWFQASVTHRSRYDPPLGAYRVICPDLRRPVSRVSGGGPSAGMPTMSLAGRPRVAWRDEVLHDLEAPAGKILGRRAHVPGRAKLR